MIALSAILMAISQHPLGYGFLSFVSIIPIIPTLRNLQSYSEAIRYGFIWGFIYNILTVYWIALNIGTTPLIASITMITSVFILLVGPVMIFVVWCMLNRRGVHILFLPFIWASVELIRSYGTLGFPWISIANSLLEYNNIIQVVEFIGMYGLTALIVLINILIYSFLINRTYISLIALSISILVPITLGVNIKNSYLETSNEVVRVSVVQPNIHLSEKWERGSQNRIMNKLISQSRELISQSPDLIVWPETSVISYLMQGDEKNYNKIKSLLSTTDTRLLAGIPYYDNLNNKVNYYNSAGYFDKTGLTGLYHKIHLVPGAEYVPFSKYLNSLEFFNFGMGNFSHGESYTLFDINNYKFGAMICLESIFPHLSRQFVKDGANFLVYVVNDGWYETAPEPQQHSSRAIFRAIETRRPVVRCANTGISMIINQTGNITDQLELNSKGSITADIRPANGLTFYVKYGDIFVYFMMLTIVVFMFKKNRYEDYV